MDDAVKDWHYTPEDSGKSYSPALYNDKIFAFFNGFFIKGKNVFIRISPRGMYFYAFFRFYGALGQKKVVIAGKRIVSINPSLALPLPKLVFFKRGSMSGGFCFEPIRIYESGGHYCLNFC